jgi:DNA repair protein RecO (recombination protein O)
MTTKYKTRAFIFKKRNINESDKIFSVFSDDFGQLDIFAKAIRKINSKLRSGIDIFFLSEIEFIQGKSRKTLTDAVVIKKFNNIYRDFKKNSMASDIAEILDNFIKGEEKDQNLFDLLNDTFYKLDNKDLKEEKYILLYYYFLWNAFSMLGYHPEVKNCAGCHDKLTQYDVYFSGKEGGVVCKKCLREDKFAMKINSDVIKVLRIILSKDWQMLSRLKIDRASQVILSDISTNAIHSFCPQVAHCRIA